MGEPAAAAGRSGGTVGASGSCRSTSGLAGVDWGEKSTIAPTSALGVSIAAGSHTRSSMSSAPSDTIVNAVEMGNLRIA